MLNNSNSKYVVWAVSALCIAAAAYLIWGAYITPNQIKRRMSYVAEGATRSVIDGKSSTFMFFRRWADLDGQSKTEQFYLNQDGTYRSKHTIYCLKSGAYEERNGIITDVGTSCPVLDQKTRTSDEKILGFPTRKYSQRADASDSSVTVTNWISPNLNAIIKQEKVDSVQNRATVLEITWVREQPNDPSIFSLPAGIPIKKENQ